MTPPQVTERDREQARTFLNTARYGWAQDVEPLASALAQARQEGAEEGEAEENRLKAIIHHMTLEVEFFGKHDQSCCAAGQPATAEDCECGLRETLAFGVEQPGMPLEPPAMTPEEEERLHAIGKRVVDKVLRAHLAGEEEKANGNERR